MNKALLIALLFLRLSFEGEAQEKVLFDHTAYLAKVHRAADCIYHGQFDSAFLMIDSLARLLPGHPVVPMLRAMNLAWQDQQTSAANGVYPAHEKELLQVIDRSLARIAENPNDIEAMFFEMSAHALLAEYYAEQGSSFKAVSEAAKTYSLIKRTINQTDQSPELLFLAGIYNYFREKYPERHPLYHSLIWLFKSGDKQKGLKQLDEAVHRSKIVNVEASLYLSYIWMHYENQPSRANYYLKCLYDRYPSNDYFAVKYLECLLAQGKYNDMPRLIDQLLASDSPYYNMCGWIFQGAWLEKSDEKKLGKAKKSYNKGLAIGEGYKKKGGYGKSLAYLGLGRVAEQEGNAELATVYYSRAIDLDCDARLTDEAKKRRAGI